MIEPNPEQYSKNSQARKRRAKRQVISALTQDERANYIDQAANRAAPSFDFFLFSFFAGAIIGLGYILDSPYMLLLGALTSPVMAPIIGISLGTVLGSTKHFSRSIAGLIISVVLVLITGSLAGIAAQIWLPLDLIQIFNHTQLSWPPFIVITIGAVFTAATLVKPKRNPAIPSIALAYSLFLPLTAAGFGLGSGIPNLWPEGIVLFAIHLSWAILVGAITLRIMGFKPYTLFGYSLGATVLLIGIILAIGFGGAGAVLKDNFSLPNLKASPTFTITSTDKPTETPIPPTHTPTPTITITITSTSTITVTPTATQLQARLQVDGFFGTYIRSEPHVESEPVAPLANGAIVIVLEEKETDKFGNRWTRIYHLESKAEGWVLEYLLITPTPHISEIENSDLDIAPSETNEVTISPTQNN